MQATSMDTTPKARRRKTRSDLVHLRSLPLTQPTTKIGQVTWAWAENEASLAAGRSRLTRDVVRPIPRLHLKSKATASETFPIATGATVAADERGAPFTSSAKLRSRQKPAGAAGESQAVQIRVLAAGRCSTGLKSSLSKA